MRTFKRFLILIIGLSVLMGCKSKLTLPLKVGTNQWIGYESLYLAQNRKLFDGHNIKLIQMPSATEAARALRNESLDVAALTLDEALTLLQYSPDLRIVLVMDNSNGGDVLLANPKIHSLQELKNKRIGVENTAVGAILLDAALQEGKMNVADVELIPVEVNVHENYYNENKIDALVTFEPHKTHLIAKGALNLFDSSHIPDLIMDVLVTRPDVINQQKAALKALIAGHFQALAYLHEHPREAASWIASRLEVNPDDVMVQLKGIEIPDLGKNRYFLTGKVSALKSKITELTALMLERQLLFKPINTEHLVEGSLLPSLKP
jgi:NitT/TauT family transport system substrate-binding protein